MRFELSRSLVIQLVGLAFGFLVIVLLGRIGGKELVGEFSAYKASNDLAVALFSFGLPQAVALHVARLGYGIRRILVASYLYGFLVMLAVAGLLHSFPFLLAQAENDDIAAIVQAVSVGMLASFGIQRGIVLAQGKVDRFSLVSALPNVSLFALAGLMLVFRSYSVGLNYMLASLTCLGATAAFVIPAARKELSKRSLDRGLLWKQSSHTVIQALLYAAIPALSYRLILWQGYGIADWGVFSVGSLVVLLPTGLLALVAPLLFVRWAVALKREDMSGLKWACAKYVSLLQIVAICALPLAPLVIQLIWGADFSAALGAVVPLCLGLWAFVFIRVVTPAYQSQAMHWPLNASCFVRLVLLVVAFGSLGAIGIKGLQALGWAWTIGEIGALCVIVLWPPHDAFGDILAAPNSGQGNDERDPFVN